VKSTRIAILAALAINGFLPQPLAAQIRGEGGIKYYQHWAGEGTLVGDMQGWGGFLLIPLNRDWSIGGGFDRLTYDMETPVDVLDIPTNDPERVDSLTRVSRIRGDLRRHFRRGRRVEPYLEAGLHVFFGDAADAQGVTLAGGVYRLTIETPTTAAWNFSMGTNLLIVDHVLLNIALSYGRAFREYRVTDTVSGQTATINPLSPLGPSLGLVVRF
jgi:hypothetical protein